MAECACIYLQHLAGAEADANTREHLHERVRNVAAWEALYECPSTSRWWLEWFPYEVHGRGPSELTQISRGFAIG